MRVEIMTVTPGLGIREAQVSLQGVLFSSQRVAGGGMALDNKGTEGRRTGKRKQVEVETYPSRFSGLDGVCFRPLLAIGAPGPAKAATPPNHISHRRKQIPLSTQ